MGLFKWIWAIFFEFLFDGLGVMLNSILENTKF